MLPTPSWRCATPATSTPAARRASPSGSSRRSRSPPAAPTSRTASSTRLRTRPTGTRPSTRSPVTSTSESTAVAGYALALADDALIASHRLSEWVARSPELEEDVALANIALDLLGQARLLLTYAGELSGPPLSEDDLAYVRPATAFHNATLLERPQPDFAVAIVRVLLLAAYQHARYSALLDSPDERLAAISAKAVKEVAYHRDHG